MEQYTTHTYQQGNVEIVVYRPVIDDIERQKRENALRRAVTAFGKATIERKGDCNVLQDRRPAG